MDIQVNRQPVFLTAAGPKAGRYVIEPAKEGQASLLISPKAATRNPR
jgi:hypothetical protein